MKAFRTLLLAAVAALGLASCDDAAEAEYSSEAASFICRNVSTIAALNNALNGYGEFCLIYADTQHYFFASPSTATQQVNKTQTSLYNSYICLAGFIVGRAGVPDLGSGSSYSLYCFDAVCPNCYRDNDIYKRLAFTDEGSTVTCGTCHRTYDLNNRGIVLSGDKGRKLLRYHLSYAGNVMVIQN